MRQIKNAFQAAISGPFIHDGSRLGSWPLNAQLLAEREKQDAATRRFHTIGPRIVGQKRPRPCHKQTRGGRTSHAVPSRPLARIAVAPVLSPELRWDDL
jgi:hypothetical protein